MENNFGLQVRKEIDTNEYCLNIFFRGSNSVCVSITSEDAETFINETNSKYNEVSDGIYKYWDIPN
jgi:hypothetical protein